jgi:hypothetical protein
LLNNIVEIKDKKKRCKGEIYRCRESTFTNSKGHIIYKKIMVPMKRLSCKGDCEEYHIGDELIDHIDCGTYDDSNCKDGVLYRMVIKNEENDWETGQVYYWEIGFIEVNKNSSIYK